MAAFQFFLVLFFFINFIRGQALNGKEEKLVVFPKEYHVKGDLFDFNTNSLLPFEIWYSEKHGRSRIDLDGGTVKNFYGPESTDKIALAIHPVSSNKGDIEMKCFESEIDYRYLLLNRIGWNSTGHSSLWHEKQVGEWRGVTYDKLNIMYKLTVYVYKNDNGFSLPRRYIIKPYRQSKARQLKMTVVDYHEFDFNVTYDDIKLPAKECENYIMIKPEPDVPDVDEMFSSFINQHNKTYNDKEIISRKKIFERNLRMVIEHNSKLHSYKMKINKFSDQDHSEMTYKNGLYIQNNETFPKYTTSFGFLPRKYDSREKGLVTSVKSQGTCGSCTAFAATAAVEIAIGKLKGIRLVDLSEQSLIDCGWDSKMRGCEGAFVHEAITQMMIHGIATEMEYGGYRGIDRECKISNMTTIYKISDYEVVCGKENIRKAIYQYGAVVVYVYAGDSFKLYSEGIFYEKGNCTGLPENHSVTIVGYGFDGNEDYWIVKNSWGQDWGEAGYMRLRTQSCNINRCVTILHP